MRKWMGNEVEWSSESLLFLLILHLRNSISMCYDPYWWWPIGLQRASGWFLQVIHRTSKSTKAPADHCLQVWSNVLVVRDGLFCFDVIWKLNLWWNSGGRGILLINAFGNCIFVQGWGQWITVWSVSGLGGDCFPQGDCSKVVFYFNLEIAPGDECLLVIFELSCQIFLDVLSLVVNCFDPAGMWGIGEWLPPKDHLHSCSKAT